MKLRIASIAFLFGSVSTGLTWLTLQPVIVRMMNTIVRLAPAGAEAQGVELTRGFLPFYLALDMLLVTVICSLVLNLMVARPLRRMEQSIDQLSRLEMEIPFFSGAGPLVSRVQAALHRMAEALRQQQAITRQQLADLSAANERLTRAQTELVSAARLATVGELAAGVATARAAGGAAVVLDPRTGKVDVLGIGYPADMPGPGWTRDGKKIVAVALSLRSSLWRFQSAGDRK